MKHQSSISICLLLLGFILQPFFCCQKADDLKPNEVSRKIEFNIGGNDKTYVQVTASTATVSGIKTYSFVGTKDPTTDNYFNIVIMTDSLRPGTYSLPAGTVHWREGSTGANNIYSGFTVTISSNVNGLVNGSFLGTLQIYTGLNVPVVDGIIQNIQVN